METGQINTAEPVTIRVEDLHKKFNSRDVLQGISFDVRKGDILSIMGPSGSGKSTLLYCMAGILRADKGSILFNGKDLVDYRSNGLTKLRRTSFGFIFQFGELVPELPVRDNIAMPLLLGGIKKKRAYEIADKWVAVVDLTNVASALPHTLSGGEVQRTAIARAMAINPEVIFADEPTGSLDSINAKKVMELFVRLAREHNKTVVIVTHSKEIAAHADRLILLKDGLVEADVTNILS